MQAQLSLNRMPGPGQRHFVLTRLHARYDASTLGEDLVFRAASGVANGSHGGNGPFEQDPVPSSLTLFQGRFILRHPWPGAIKCEAPVRGVYDGPPVGVREQVQAVTDAAFAPRDGTDVEKCVETPVHALAGAIHSETPALPPQPPPTSGSGCGCRSDVPAGAGALFVVRPPPVAGLGR